MSKIIISRVPFRLPLGGGSTDLPSYYEKYGGFIFGAAVNLYMDVFVKEPRSDDLIHVHYKHFEAVPRVSEVNHEIVRQALMMQGVKNKIAISFKADTPAGTGLGSSGACAVAVLKGIAAYRGRELANGEAAELSFRLTRALNLPDGVQDPYVCAHGGFVVLEIEKGGSVHVIKPRISSDTTERFFGDSLFYYTGVVRESRKILERQNAGRVLELKHRTKEIGRAIFAAFKSGDLDRFGALLDEHWRIKKSMSDAISNDFFDGVYRRALAAGALGGKLMGAGGGGYFMFVCPSSLVRRRVRKALSRFGMREMNFTLDTKGARTRAIRL